ncbi:MAG: DinB family protein [Candidatus Schekmanbacteria bacterium]|nr:DinB family protein [Candidatus Schekmanbacteria bacterium]
MRSKLLQQQFELNHYVIKANTEGLTESEALMQPPQGGNCTNWVVGHILASRMRTVGLLAKPAFWTTTGASRYERGSLPVREREAALPALADLLALLDESQDLILSGLSALTEADLDRTGERGTVAESLALLSFHESYHAGQLGLLRRMAGKPGAIP